MAVALRARLRLLSARSAAMKGNQPGSTSPDLLVIAEREPDIVGDIRVLSALEADGDNDSLSLSDLAPDGPVVQRLFVRIAAISRLLFAPVSNDDLRRGGGWGVDDE